MWPSYQNTFCPLPDADKDALEKWQQDQTNRAQEVLDVLKPVADTDRSGFVSTQEGAHFRKVMEHGYLCHAVMVSQGASPATIASASGLSEEAAVNLLVEYMKCRAQVRKAGIAELPEVSLVAKK